MKITLDINDELLAKAEAVSTREKKSLVALIEEALRWRLRSNSKPAAPVRTALPVFAGRGGLVEGVDPTSNRALLAAAGDDP